MSVHVCECKAVRGADSNKQVLYAHNLYLSVLYIIRDTLRIHRAVMRYTPGKGRPSVQQEPSAGGGSSSASSGSSSSASADGNTYAHLLGRVTTVLHFVHEQV
jgi:hypothetical protein